MKIKLAVLTVFSSFIVMLSHVNLAAAPGDLDPTFGVGGKTIMPVKGWLIVNRTLPQADGKLLTIGFDDGPGERFSFRHSGNGAVDATFRMFGIPYNVDFLDFAIQSNLKILAVRDEGYVVDGNYRSAFGLYRFNSDGTIDPSFGTNGIVNTQIANNSFARHIALQSDGKIVVAGLSTDNLIPYPILGGPSYKRTIVRYYPNGVIDETFGNNGIVTSNDESCRPYLQPDDKLLCRTPNTLIRYDRYGAPDIEFGTNGIIFVGPDSGGLAIQANGKILVGVSENTQTSIQRYMPNGTADTTFGTNGAITIPNSTWALAVQRNGKVISAGDLNGSFAISRYNQNGTVDTGFGTNGNVITTFENASGSQIHDLFLQPDNKIVASGSVAFGSFYNSSPAIVRYLNDPLETFVEISGKVLTPDGRGIRNAVVSLVDSQGVRVTTMTSSFGIYAFGDVGSGETYSLTVSSKRYRFAPRILQSVNSNLTNVDLLALE